tara:strand:- start:2356 stop:3246 length:891 start_codon:yes stop_codon:yes gene_type:complete
MNKVEAALLSFLSKAAQGEAEMPRHILEDFGKSAQKALEKQFTNENRDFYLRMSNVGRPLCQLQMQAKNVKPETPTYDFKMRMILGDVIEALVISLLEAAGVNVKNKHKKVELKVDKKNSITGEFDIELDDGIYDIKTVSPYAFEYKFKSDNAFERIKESDSFGYVSQGLGYGMANKVPFRGWLAVNKSTGEIAVAEAVDNKEERENVYDNIRKVVKAISSDKPFQRSFTDNEEVYYGKPTGNRTLGIECSYCPYKYDCWGNIEFRRQLPSKGKNPKWVYYTYISEEWQDRLNDNS